MRAMRTLSYAAAIGFFLVFHGLNVHKHLRFSRMGAYSRSLLEFLDMRHARERYLLILQGSRPVGYSGMRVAQVREGEGTYVVTLDGFVALAHAWLGRQGEIALEGDILLDALGEALSLDLRLTVSGATFTFAGARDGADLAVDIVKDGRPLGLPLRLPRGMGFADALFPIPPLGELSVGETREIPYFDPLSRTQAVCKLHVASREEIVHMGVSMEALSVEVQLPAGLYQVTAALDGDILRVRTPGDMELRQSTRAHAHNVFRR